MASLLLPVLHGSTLHDGSCAPDLIVADGLCPRIAELLPAATQPSLSLGRSASPLAEIGQALQLRRLAGRPVHTLHLVAHGRAGAFQLGGQWITAASLIAQAEQLAQWQVSRIALWSCEVGADRDFVALLEELTGARVWASGSILGRRAGGSHWGLESSQGLAAPQAPWEQATLQAWPYQLGTLTFGNVYQVTGVADKEQQLCIYNPNAPLGSITVSDNTAGSFTGNDVLVQATINSSVTYIWVSRPIKVNGRVIGFYGWTDSSFSDTTLFPAGFADVQTAGNSDPDSNVGTNTGYVFVLPGNESFFSSGAINSSSDRVDNAMNAAATDPAITVTTINSLTINEASEWAVFTVSGLANAGVLLNVVQGSGQGFANLGASPSIEVWNGTNWVVYSAATSTISASGILYARVRILNERDTPFEGPETFILRATNTNGDQFDGTGTIVDDGTGVIFPSPTNTTPTTFVTTGLDDDRPLSVNSLTVNEGSTYAVFTVTGTAGQLALLSLRDASGDGGTDAPFNKADLRLGGTTLPTIQYYDGTNWQNYSAATPPAILGTGTLLVRVDITAESDIGTDGPETFKLDVANGGGTVVTGTGTIVDDGTGTKWDFTGGSDPGTPSTGPGPSFDDDRAITVSNITVNEVSPYAVFTVSGAAGQAVSLALANGTVNPASNGTANWDFGTPAGSVLEFFEASGWRTYTPGSVLNLDAFGNLLVRTAINNDGTADNDETFRLNATNIAGTTVFGTATIKDDGTGTRWSFIAGNDPGTATTNPGPNAALGFDDDRPLTVSDITVNEGSTYAVFSIGGAVGQLALLGLRDATGDGAVDAPLNKADLRQGGTLPKLQYFDGTWKDYNAANPPAIPVTGPLLVRVEITAEQESAVDGPETFKLDVSNTSGTTVTGTATIVDDGSGTKWAFATASDPGTPSNGPGTGGFDDDRPLAINSISVNEGSDYAVFTVTGAANQLTTLGLSNGTTIGLTNVEVFTSGLWTPYATGTVTLNGSGQLLVRVAINPEKDSFADNGETFTLTAANTSGASVVGTGTIFDDGTGTKWTFTGPNDPGTPTTGPGPSFDDDRPVSINNITVNEGSPYAMFTVSGAAGQAVSLALANGTVDPATNGTTSWDFGSEAGSALEFFDGNAWRPYTAGSLVNLDGLGTLKVRTAINNDGTPDNNETFRLSATNTVNTTVHGNATIKDDGTGTKWNFIAGNDPGTFTTNPGPNAAPGFDDDRTLTVSDVTVNEGSTYVVFSVTGATGQLALLSLRDVIGDGGVDAPLNLADLRQASGLPPIQYYDGTTWRDYNAANPPAIPGSGPLLVRVDISGEQEATLDGPETFKLDVSNTGGGTSTGVATIKDDGDGKKFIFAPNGTYTEPSGPGLGFDDDRSLSVDSITVNEGSPYAVFTVSGEPSQRAILTLTNGTTSGLSGLQVFNGSDWVSYTAGTAVALNANGKLLVRTSVPPENEPAIDNGETFTLGASNTSGAVAIGTATVKDDGSGLIYPDAIPSGDLPQTTTGPAATFDDDRTLSVNSITVNEASTYAVFTVTGAPGQFTTLALTNGTTSGLGPALEVFNGTGWVPYGGAVALNANGKLLVRTVITPEQDFGIDNGETFTLTATNTGGTNAIGTATIKDDGSGVLFPNDSPSNDTPQAITGPSAAFDDDRTLSVNSITVNEASTYAVFTVTGAAGQFTTLTLTNGNTTGLSGLQVFDPSADGGAGDWVDYTGAVALNANGKLLVRTVITPEQEPGIDNGETFTLTATNTGGSTFTGTATIRDNGTGLIFPDANPTNNTPQTITGPSAAFDDDRTLTVNSITVNEASTYASFTVTGNTGQYTLLSLSGASGDGPEVPLGAADLRSLGNLPTIQYLDGTTWRNYDAANPPAIPNANGLRVRVDISAEQDAGVDGPETFRLVATNTGGTEAAGGNATIRDDGTGDRFSFDANTGTPGFSTGPGLTFDDDRVMTVSNVTVNEGSADFKFAVYDVTGAAGQWALLSLTGASGSGTPDAAGGAADLRTNGTLPTIQYLNNGVWTDYNPLLPPTIPAGPGGLRVRVDISAEQDNPLDGPETFRLVATTTGGTVSDGGNTTIKDDGSGFRWTFEAGNTGPGTRSATEGPGTGFDDDRPPTKLNMESASDSGKVVDLVTANGKPTLQIVGATGKSGLLSLQGVNNATLTRGVNYTVREVELTDKPGQSVYMIDLIDSDPSTPGNQSYGTYFQGQTTGNTTNTADGVYNILFNGTKIDDFEIRTRPLSQAKRVNCLTRLFGGAGDLGLESVLFGYRTPKAAGTNGDDVLNGTNNANDTLIGRNGSDLLNGVGDRLTGDSFDPALNVSTNQQDVLTGGRGADEFQLGDIAGVFYNRGGANDFARITDFDRFDNLILRGSFADYTLAAGAPGELNLSLTAGNELIARISGVGVAGLTTDALRLDFLRSQSYL